MAYISADDLIREFGEQEMRELTDRGNNGVIDTDLAEQKIATAQSEVDGYLRGRVDVPFDDDAIPPVIAEIMLNVTRYRLYLEPTETVSQRYNTAINRLRDIAAGKVVLDTGTQVRSVGTPKIKVDESPLGTDILDGYVDGYHGHYRR